MTPATASKPARERLGVAILMAAVWAGLATPGRAAEPAASYDPGRRTVVTPARRAVSTFDLGRSAYRLSEEDLESAQVLDGPAAIAELPGGWLQRTNRGAGAPVLRGLIGPSNLIVVDGVRYNLSTFRTGPNQYAALVDPLALDAVELVLGPGSVLYGSDAMGGIVSYHVRDVPEAEGLSGRVAGRFASADRAAEGSLQAGARRGRVAGWVGGSRRRHDRLRTGGGGTAPMSSYVQSDLRTRAALDLPGAWQLSGTWLGSWTEDAGRTDSLGRGDVRLYDTTDQLAILALRRRDRFRPVSDVHVALSLHHLDDRVARFRCERDDVGSVLDRAACAERRPETLTRVTRTRDEVTALGLTSHVTAGRRDGRFVVTSGAEARFERVTSAADDATPESGFEPVASDRGTFSDGSTYGGADVFAHVEGRPLADADGVELVVEAGARMSHVRAAADDVPGIGNVNYATTGAVGSLGVRAILKQRVNVYASWAQGFRAPNLQETTALGDTGSLFELPNGDLKPEKSHGFELGARVALPGITAGVAFWRLLLRDAIVREPAQLDGMDTVEGRDVVRRVNAESADYTGVEIQAESGRWHGLSLFAAGAWQRGDVSREGEATEPARRVPPLNGRVGLRWARPWRGLQAAMWVQGAARQDRLSGGDRGDLRICEDADRPGSSLGDSCEGTPGWVTLHASVGLEPVPGLALNLRLDNVLDQRYRMHGSGFDAPGFDARLGMRYAF